jgi:hypothetical protein
VCLDVSLFLCFFLPSPFSSCFICNLTALLHLTLECPLVVPSSFLAQLPASQPFISSPVPSVFGSDRNRDKSGSPFHLQKPGIGPCISLEPTLPRARAWWWW